MITQLSVVLVLVAACYAKSDIEIKAWFFSIAVVCNKDFTIAAEELAMLQEHKIPDSANAKCLMACVFKKSKLMDDKGNYDLDTTTKWVNAEFSDNSTRLEAANKVFDICKNVNDATVSDGEKGCERAFLLSKCLTENSPKIGFEMH